jgi:hypothetical protein
MILTPILLLNMLIASMGNTYQRVIAISEKERIRQVFDKRSKFFFFRIWFFRS